MEHFKNKSENFYREIRNVEIYDAKDILFEDQYKGIFPDPNLALYKFDINPESFSRKIPTKTQGGNYFTEIEITFPLLDLSESIVDKCYEIFNDKKFAVVLFSNTDKQMFGNKREPLKIEIIDGRKLDSSGNDEETIVISGDTIIKPKIQNL